MALAGIEFEFEFVENVGGTLSPPDTPLYRALEEFAPRSSPGRRCAPMVNPGFTDSHYMRAAFGSVAYGFMPMRMDPLLAGTLVHSADERASMDDLELGRPLLPARRPHDGGGGMSPPNVRLGGMALRNGILVHSLDHWAAAVRTDDGERQAGVGPEAGACPTRSCARRSCAASRGWRRRPTCSRSCGGACPRRGCRSRGRGWVPRWPARRSSHRPCAAAGSIRPSASRSPPRRRLPPRSWRSAAREIAGYHGAEHKAIGGVRAGDRRGRCVEGARALRVAHGRARSSCSRPPAMRLRAAFRSRAAGRPGSRSAWRRSAPRPRRSAGWGAIASTPSPVRCAGPGSSSSGSPRPGSRRAAELEVAEAALGEVLRLEGAWSQIR